jgi:hypothetical protein
MIQVFAEYIYWEDYINGMYEIPKKEEEELYVLSAINMLSNKELFLNTCKELLGQWRISSNVNLTNKQCNRKAWLGQAACNFKYKVPELCTRIAWSRLNQETQQEANNVADKIINSFEVNYENKNTKLYY